MCGTLPYMAPELWRRAQAGYRGLPVDVWAFGAVVFEMLHRRTPFAGSDAAIIRRRVCQAQPVLRLDLPRAFRSLIETCLTRAPAKRPDMSTLRLPVPKS